MRCVNIITESENDVNIKLIVRVILVNMSYPVLVMTRLRKIEAKKSPLPFWGSGLGWLIECL
jgi:hypothetical protein